MASLAHEPRSSPEVITRASVIGRCGATLASAGVTAVLSLLNRRTRFRFTGMYQADHPVLRNVALFDRENPALLLAGGTIPLAGIRSAVAGSAAPCASRSYAVAPIRMRSGREWGALCHFDFRPRLLPSTELAILHGAAALVAVWLTDGELPREFIEQDSTSVDAPARTACTTR